MTDFDSDTSSVVLHPGILLDALEQIVLTVMAPSAIGVSVRRYAKLPTADEMRHAIKEEKWVTVHRATNSLFLLSPGEEGPAAQAIERLDGPEANESAEFAIELGLASWPEWGDEYRERFKPRTAIPLPEDLPQA